MGLVTCLPESGRLQINDWREGWLSVSLPRLSVPEIGKHAPVKSTCNLRVFQRSLSSGHSETPKKVYKARESVNVSCYRHCKAVGDTSHWRNLYSKGNRLLLVVAEELYGHALPQSEFLPHLLLESSSP